MTKYTIRTSNSETGEVIDRPMTAEEIAEHEALTAEVLAEIQAKEQKALAAASAVAKLEAIGFTAEEIAALRG